MRCVLETERLALRELAVPDLDFVATMLGDAEVMRYFPKPLSRAESRAWLDRQRRRYADHGHGLWLAVERTSGCSVGQTGLLAQEVEGVAEHEIAYLLHRPFWQRGFATEAGLAIRDLAFMTLAVPRVISLVRPENEPSRAVARRLGMRPGREVLFKGFVHTVFSVTRETT